MGENTKKFRMIEVILTVICIVFVAEAAAPVASMGNSQFFWWIVLIILYLVPYGLMAAELGTTYPGEGGLYDWVKRAYGPKMGTREAWYYWVNYPIWKASLAVMAPQVLQVAFGLHIGKIPALIIELVFIWLVVLVSMFRVSDSAWVLKGSAIIKVFLALTVGILGIYYATRHGIANEMTLQSFLPKFDIKSLSFLAVIIFNFHGFEIIATMSHTMEHPKRQIPLSIIIGGLVIAGIYLFTAFGIGVAIPSSKISTSTGLIDSIEILTGGGRSIFLSLIAILFLITLFGNMMAWALGANSVAAHAAQNGDMPKIFGTKNSRTGMPRGAAIMNGIVASVIVIVAVFIPNEDLFWSFFALNLVMILLAYALVFPTFVKLRNSDANRERPFKVGGNKGFITAFAASPFILTVAAILLLIVPVDLEMNSIINSLPISLGAVGFILIGEIIAIRCAKKKRK